MIDNNMKNIAFIDGQNLYLGTRSSDKPWEVDLSKFKFYLKNKYNVDEIYYFLGYVQDENGELYDEIQKSGLILRFRQHNSFMLEKRKAMWIRI